MEPTDSIRATGIHLCARRSPARALVNFSFNSTQLGFLFPDSSRLSTVFLTYTTLELIELASCMILKTRTQVITVSTR